MTSSGNARRVFFMPKSSRMSKVDDVLKEHDEAALFFYPALCKCMCVFWC